MQVFGGADDNKSCLAARLIIWQGRQLPQRAYIHSNQMLLYRVHWFDFKILEMYGTWENCALRGPSLVAKNPTTGQQT